MFFDRFLFAGRTEWSLASNQLIQTLDQLRRDNIPVMDLTESNPTRAGIAYPSSKILEPLTDRRNLIYVPAAEGLFSAREAVSRYYQEKGVSLPPEQILLTSSTSEGYAHLFRLLANPGERILFPQPSYPLFQFLTDLNDIEMAPYPLEYVEERWRMDFDQLEEAIDEKTKAIAVVNPNNPTGSFVRREDRQALNALARRHGLALISDEVFGDYVLNAHQDYASLAGNDEVLTFVLNGISKTLGLPQMKLAWIAMSGPPDSLKTAKERLEIIADTYLSVNTPVQQALPVWLGLRPEIQAGILDRIRRNYTYIHRLSGVSSSCRLVPSEGGWYAVLKIPQWHSEEEWILKFLKEDQTLVHPGYFFDFENEAYVILSLLPPPEVFENGARRIFQRIETEDLKNLKA